MRWLKILFTRKKDIKEFKQVPKAAPWEMPEFKLEFVGYFFIDPKYIKKMFSKNEYEVNK